MYSASSPPSLCSECCWSAPFATCADSHAWSRRGASDRFRNVMFQSPPGAASFRCDIGVRALHRRKMHDCAGGIVPQLILCSQPDCLLPQAAERVRCIMQSLTYDFNTRTFSNIQKTYLILTNASPCELVR